MKRGKPMLREVEVDSIKYQYEVGKLETNITESGRTQTFPNWDVKGVREMYYRETYIDVTEEEYLSTIRILGPDADYGITPENVKTFITGHQRYFELPIEEPANA
jgi:hypothetical protein